MKYPVIFVSKQKNTLIVTKYLLQRLMLTQFFSGEYWSILKDC